MADLRYAIVFVSDMSRSVAFYRDILSLPLKFESPGWSEFATGDMTLALHPSSGPAATCYRSRPAPPAHVQLGLHVPNLDEFHQRMIAAQVPCLMPPTKQDFGGRLAVYADPDGLPFTIGEAPPRAATS